MSVHGGQGHLQAQRTQYGLASMIRGCAPKSTTKTQKWHKIALLDVSKRSLSDLWQLHAAPESIQELSEEIGPRWRNTTNMYHKPLNSGHSQTPDPKAAAALAAAVAET